MPGVVILGMLTVVGPYRLKKGRFEDNFLVFEREGVQCIREWTSLTGERVKTDPAFAVTMEYSRIQARAATTSSWVYKQMPAERKKRGVYPVLRSIAFWLFERGFTVEGVYVLLRDVVLMADAEKSAAVIEDVYRRFAHGLVKEAMEELFEHVVAEVTEDSTAVVCEERGYEGRVCGSGCRLGTRVCAEEREAAIAFADSLLEELFTGGIEAWVVEDIVVGVGPP